MRTPSSARRSWDLAVVSELALIDLALAFNAVPGWLRAIGLVPLVFILPGYAFAAVLFPPGTLPRDDRVVFVVAFSIGAAAIGGLGLQVFLRLDGHVWAALLASVTVLASVIAVVRRHAVPLSAIQGGPGWPRVSPLAAVAIVAAAAIGGGAIAIATHGVQRQRAQSHFTSLWVLSSSGGRDPARGPVAIGVWNHEGAGLNYRLLVTRGDATVRDWRVHVDSNRRWLTLLSGAAVSGKGPLVVGVYRGGTLRARAALRRDRALVHGCRRCRHARASAPTNPGRAQPRRRRSRRDREPA